MADQHRQGHPCTGRKMKIMVAFMLGFYFSACCPPIVPSSISAGHAKCSFVIYTIENSHNVYKRIILCYWKNTTEVVWSKQWQINK